MAPLTRKGKVGVLNSKVGLVEKWRYAEDSKKRKCMYKHVFFAMRTPCLVVNMRSIVQ